MFGIEGRVRWLPLALIAVLCIGGVWFYKMYFSSTDAAIRHAEAFLFRRMTVAQLAEQGGFRFFYTTNRVAGDLSEDNDGSIDNRFGTSREDTLYSPNGYG